MTSPRLGRIKALLRKEFIQILRDPSAILVAFVLPVVLLLLNGYGLSLDAKHVPFGVAIEARTPETDSLFDTFADTPYLHARRYDTTSQAEAALLNGTIQGYAVIRADTIRRLSDPARSQPFLVVVDGVDANTARILQGYALSVLQLWYDGRKSFSIASQAPIVLQHRYWFNPELRSASFIVPGLIAVIMTLVGALLTALIVAREWERGTMETLLSSPAHIGEIVLSKLLANFVLGMMAMAVSVALGIMLFHVPFRGSFSLLILTSSLFLMSALSLGLLISTTARNQFVAAQITFIVTYMPALMLSGLLFDITSMPLWLQDLTHLVPARYFVSCLQSLFLAGDIERILLPNSIFLAIFAAVVSFVTLRRMPRNLET